MIRMRRVSNIHELAIVLMLLASIVNMPAATITQAQAQTAARPFGLPFASPPGPATWLIVQQYGNTTGGYNFGKYWYAAGQGFHFGVDFSAACQTPLVAMADGVIDEVDVPGYGSLPHSLGIRHAQLGYITFYGHLYSRATVVRGQAVKRGDVVGLSGDPDSTCVSRPHLHLEIRSLNYAIAYDPAQLIDADWNMLSSIGSNGASSFAKDLYNPNRWQTIDDQPETHFGGNILNAYRAAWPPAARNQPPPRTLAAFTVPPDANSAVTLKRLTAAGCCSQAWWSPDSASVRFWNGADGQLATLNAVDLNGAPQTINVPPPGILSNDGQYALQADLQKPNQIAVMRLSDQKTFPLATGGAWPRFSPDSTRILWQHFPADNVPGGVIPLTDVWIANVDGSGRTLIGTQPGGSVAWLDDDRLLLSQRVGQTNVSTLAIYTISTKKSAPLLTAKNLRNVSIAPGGATLAYYLMWQGDASGMYLLPTQPNASPVKLPFFGSWRWRDAQSLVYIPYTPGSAPSFVLYDIHSGQSRPLSDPNAQPFSILNDDWAMAPNGRALTLWNARDRAIWRLSLP